MTVKSSEQGNISHKHLRSGVCLTKASYLDLWVLAAVLWPDPDVLGLVSLSWFKTFLAVADSSLASFLSQWKWVHCCLTLMAVALKWVQIINIVWLLHLLCLLLMLGVRVITTHLLGLIFETLWIVISAWKSWLCFLSACWARFCIYSPRSGCILWTVKHSLVLPWSFPMPGASVTG